VIVFSPSSANEKHRSIQGCCLLALSSTALIGLARGANTIVKSTKQTFMMAVSSIPEDLLFSLRAIPFLARFSYFIPSRICIVLTMAEADIFPFTRPILATSILAGVFVFVFFFVYVLTAPLRHFARTDGKPGSLKVQTIDDRSRYYIFHRVILRRPLRQRTRK